MKLDAENAKKWIENAENVDYEVHRVNVDNATGKVMGEPKVDPWTPKE
jgi:hypothetical protein